MVNFLCPSTQNVKFRSVSTIGFLNFFYFLILCNFNVLKIHRYKDLHLKNIRVSGGYKTLYFI